VTIASAHGDAGPFTDWIIAASPGVAQATRQYSERVDDAASSVETLAGQAASDRAYVETARLALEEAGLDPNQYVWRDGSKPFTSVIHGIAPSAKANSNELPTTAWSRSVLGEMAQLLAPEIPVGTVMLFYDAAAPLGWSRLTEHDDKTLRVVG